MSEHTTHQSSFEKAYEGFKALKYEWIKGLADENRRRRGEADEDSKSRSTERSVQQDGTSE